jgi:hypothetical protein
LELIVQRLEPPISAPVHALGLSREGIVDRIGLAEPIPEFLGTVGRTREGALVLGLIFQAMAVSTTEVATTIDDAAEA